MSIVNETTQETVRGSVELPPLDKFSAKLDSNLDASAQRVPGRESAFEVAYWLVQPELQLLETLTAFDDARAKLEALAAFAKELRDEAAEIRSSEPTIVAYCAAERAHARCIELILATQPDPLAGKDGGA